MLICQPYKNEILPFWRFKTPEIAKESSEKIYDMFLNYLNNLGQIWLINIYKWVLPEADVTLIIRGEYDAEHDYEQLEKGTGDPEKAISAEIVFKKWQEAEENEKYKAMKKEWKKQFG